MELVGIYSITNSVNGKMYIGQSGDIKWRWTKHLEALRGHSHHNRHLQSAFDMYGENVFKFDVICECTKGELNDLEEYYIRMFDTYDNGYNLDFGGNGIRGYKHTDEEIEKMRSLHNAEHVLQFDSDFNLITEWVGGISHAAKTLKYTYACIKRRCDHSRSESLYKGCYWVYKSEYDDPRFTWDGYLRGIKLFDRGQASINARSRRVIMYDRSLNIIKSWNSITDASNDGCNATSIHQICHKQANKKLYKDHIFAFEGYDFSDGYFDDVLIKQM